MTPSTRANLLTALAALLIVGAGLGAGRFLGAPQTPEEPAAAVAPPAPAPRQVPVDWTSAGEQELQQASVRAIVISKSTCPMCARAKQWLAANGGEGVAIWEGEDDATRNALAARISTRVVPTLVVRDRVVHGFDPQTWAAALRGDPRG